MGYRITRLQDFGWAMRTCRTLLERERWPRERLEDSRQDRLEELAGHAREHAALWRERLPRGRIALGDLPVTAKGDRMERFDELVTDRRLHLDALLDELCLRVVLRDRDGDAPGRLRTRVGTRLAELGVPRPSVQVETVDALERSPSGKLQMIVAEPAAATTARR